MKFPSNLTFSKIKLITNKISNNLLHNVLYQKLFDFLENYWLVLKTIFKLKYILPVIAAVICMGVTFVCFTISKDPILYWEHIREVLLHWKKLLSGDLPVVKTIEPKSIIIQINDFLLNNWKYFIGLLTVQNLTNVLTFATGVLDFIIIKTILIADFALKHWAVLTAGTISLPILKYFNIFFIGTIINSICKPIMFSFKSTITSISNMMISYRALEEPIQLLITKVFGSLTWIITLPVNFVAQSFHKFFTCLKYLLDLIITALNWVFDKFKAIWEALLKIFFKGGDSSGPDPGPEGDYNGNRPSGRSIFGSDDSTVNDTVVSAYRPCGITSFNGLNLMGPRIMAATVVTLILEMTMKLLQPPVTTPPVAEVLPIAESEIILVAEEITHVTLATEISMVFVIIKAIIIISPPLLLVRA